MTIELIVRYFHFLSIFVLVSTVVVELLLIRKINTRAEISFLSKIDAFYGLSSVLVVAAGLTLWLGVGKPAEFYSQNPFFWVKLGLAILLGLLSIYPSIYFYKHKKGEPTQEVETPKLVRLLIYFEVVCLIIIPLMAVLMARGVVA